MLGKKLAELSASHINYPRFMCDPRLTLTVILSVIFPKSSRFAKKYILGLAIYRDLWYYI